jgi:hypothetical protein
MPVNQVLRRCRKKDHHLRATLDRNKISSMVENACLTVGFQAPIMPGKGMKERKRMEGRKEGRKERRKDGR